MEKKENSQYDGIALIADPIHGYISFTVPYYDANKEATEKDLIDSLWMQRSRQIYQLQSARWVYPSAEHSRFQHMLGTMHVAGRFARQLYTSLKATTGGCPSLPYIEELLRVTALLHDIGHGPFGHFFDDNFLDQFGINHEDLGQRIIAGDLGGIIKKIRRSPGGGFEKGEELDPSQIAFLIKKDKKKEKGKHPDWLRFLQPLLSGIYTVDNLDYVLRDSYMCGVAIGPVDLERLIHYTFFTKDGLTLHKAGGSALNMFLNARLYLYSNVYYHRTTRAIDLHLKELFGGTGNGPMPAGNDQVEALKSELDKAKKEQLYLLAEFDNFKKNVVKERSDIRKYGSERLLVELLNVLDIFDTALRSEVTPENAASFKKGMQMTASELRAVLGRFGVEEIPAEGKPFDPNVHEAISSEASDKVPEGHITQVFKKPFKLHDRVIRPGQVVVANAKS
jgi:HD superfamily phosphohydrolase